MSHSGGHGYPVTKQMRLERRKRAEDLQKEYDTRYPTLQTKLDSLPPAPAAAKQRARLTKQIEADKLKKSIKVGLKDLEESLASPHEEVKQKLQKKYMKGQK